MAKETSEQAVQTDTGGGGEGGGEDYETPLIAATELTRYVHVHLYKDQHLYMYMCRSCALYI